MRPEYQQVLENVKKLTQGGAQPADIVNYLRIEGLTVDDLETFVEGPSVLGQAKEAVKGIIPGAVGLVETAGVGAASMLPLAVCRRCSRQGRSGPRSRPCSAASRSAMLTPEAPVARPMAISALGGGKGCHGLPLA